MPKSTFFIVTPSYNQAHFISQTIDSVLMQKGDFSIVYWVIDGKSKDKTTKILKKYGDKIQWISETDKGQTDAINKGVHKLLLQKNLKHTFFAYINSDDWYLPHTFKLATDVFLKNPKLQWLCGDAIIVDEQNKEIHHLIRFYKKMLRQVLLYIPSFIKIANPIPQPAVFIRASAIFKVGFFDTSLRYVMDYEYWLRLSHQFGPPAILPQTLAGFRIHGQSKGGTAFVKQFDEALAVAKKYTNQPLVVLAHLLHNWLIKLIYTVIK